MAIRKKTMPRNSRLRNAGRLAKLAMTKVFRSRVPMETRETTLRGDSHGGAEVVRVCETTQDGAPQFRDVNVGEQKPYVEIYRANQPNREMDMICSPT